MQVMYGVADLSGSPPWREAATGSETASDLVLGLLNQHILIGDQTRNSDEALLGLVLQQEGVKTSDRFPCALSEEGGLVPHVR